jgi:SAM-dependent methyltransferase
MNVEIRKFWENADLAQINPGRENDAPEGWDVRGELRELFGARAVAEIGCGYGRLCSGFAPERYVGYDINPQALRLAEQRNPGYRFHIMRNDDDFEVANAALMYAVCLHIHDEDIEAFIGRICDKARFVVLAEIMGREWRRPGDPPVFNRAAQEYIDLFTRRGFAVDDIVVAPYQRYADTQITFLAFNRSASPA